MPQWLEQLAITLPPQLGAALLSGVNVGLWVAIVALCNARQGDTARWNVYGGIGVILTVLGIAALDNGQLWLGVEVLFGLLGCLGLLVEARNLREWKAGQSQEAPPQN